MNLVYFQQAGRPNFGDDLNSWMWKSLFPKELCGDDGVNLSGIGTILNASLMPPGRKWIVLGSGVGYGCVPSDWGGPKWKVLALRGPLSAGVLKLRPELAVTDAAILLREIAGLDSIPENERNGIVFVPHHSCIQTGNWELACMIAGLEYLDPLSDSRLLVERIRHAKCVIADAMHGAIVADTMRVPWIPVVTGSSISTFKWLDWTQSMRMDYRPHVLSPSTGIEKFRNMTNWMYGEENFVQDASEEIVVAHYQRAQRYRGAKWWRGWVRAARGISYAVPAKIIGSLRASESWKNEAIAHVENAAKSLQIASKMPSMLSDEKVFAQKSERMREAVAMVPRCIDELRVL